MSETTSKKPQIQPQDKYVLRFPDGMRQRLKKLAAENGRSLNAEIIARLEASFATESRAGGFGVPEDVASGLAQKDKDHLRSLIREIVKEQIEEEGKTGE